MTELQGLSGLYCLNLGHSHGEELGTLAATQMSTLSYSSNWTVAHISPTDWRDTSSRTTEGPP